MNVEVERRSGVPKWSLEVESRNESRSAEISLEIAYNIIKSNQNQNLPLPFPSLPFVRGSFPRFSLSPIVSFSRTIKKKKKNKQESMRTNERTNERRINLSMDM